MDLIKKEIAKQTTFTETGILVRIHSKMSSLYKTFIRHKYAIEQHSEFVLINYTTSFRKIYSCDLHMPSLIIKNDT